MSLSLEQLIAVNDEVAGLVRAGVPLELGLRQVAVDSSGQLRRVSSDLAAALNRGESLPQALDSCGHGFPPVYRAIVEAGLKARNLPRALEAVAGFAQSALELRRQLALAMIYPLIVVAIAYGLFVLFLMHIEPAWTDTLAGFHYPQTWSLQAMSWLRERLRWWAPTVPIVAALALAIVWFRAWRTSVGGRGLIGGRVFRMVHVANFAELLGILVEQDVPLTEGLPLAAEATSDRALQADCRVITERVSAGLPLAQAVADRRSLPPLLRWLLQATETSPTLAAALQQAAETYRARAASRAEWLKVSLPLFATIVIGGGATTLYALTLFLPMTHFLTQLTVE
jgi:general secretion pathway protein F